MMQKRVLRSQRAYIKQDVRTGNEREKVIVVGRTPRGKVLWHYPNRTEISSCDVKAIKGPWSPKKD